MAILEQEMTSLVVEQAQEQSLDQFSTKQPMVLSCGGIFIPRKPTDPPNDALYEILNVANSKEPTKVVTGSIPRNILQEVLHKESMN